MLPPEAEGIEDPLVVSEFAVELENTVVVPSFGFTSFDWGSR